MSDKIKEKLSELTKNRFNFITSRGNSAIEKALKIAKKIGYEKVYIANQGGWISYKISAKRLNLEIEELDSNYGLLCSDQIEKIKDSILLLNSMPAYIAYQEFEEIYDVCKKNGNILIVDITATIGEPCVGDIFVCSFSKTKPVNFGKLGLLSFNEDVFNILTIKDHEYEKDLLTKLNDIEKRKKLLKDKAKEIKEDLIKYDIIHKNHEGINVIVKFQDIKTKEKIIEYCLNNKLEFVECPKYIKVLENAISIEVKKSI